MSSIINTMQTPKKYSCNSNGSQTKATLSQQKPKSTPLNKTSPGDSSEG